MRYVYVVDSVDIAKYRDYRICARCIVQNENKEILLLYYSKDDFYQFPGGECEKGESLEQCIVRECEEETGYIVQIEKKYPLVIEEYSDYKALNFYYLCNYKKAGQLKRSEYETQEQIEMIWVSYKDLLDYLHKHINLMDRNSIEYRMERKELLIANHIII